MPANPTDLSKGIEPGSMAYGERQNLEQGLYDTLNSSPAPVGGGVPGPVSGGGSAIGALLSGEIESDGLPLTDGLSVGPGATPMPHDPMLGSRAQKLREMATQSSSPQIRAAARNELRRMAREEI